MERAVLLHQMQGKRQGVEVHLGAKLKVNSRLGIALLLAKTVGAVAFFQIGPTPVDKWVKSLIYNKVEVGSRGSA